MAQKKPNDDTKKASPSSSTTSTEMQPPVRKSRRARELLAQYYVGLNSKGDQQKINEYNIDGAHFNSEKYVKKMIKEKHLNELIRLNKSMNDGEFLVTE
jgi:hypothetical protein